MHAPAEHRVRHDVDEWLWIESALEYERDGFSKHLERRRGHHVAEQLDEVCVRGIGAEYERSLSERVEERPATRDIGRRARGDDE
jgi:hypothetical protein